MKAPAKDAPAPSQQPALQAQAEQLAVYLKGLTVEQLQKAMQLSPAMAVKTRQLIQNWNTSHSTLPALDIFLGDIYSGLQVQTFTDADRDYANQHLYILSGLYGVLKALDTVQPYRLEMGYKLPDYPTLYQFWGKVVADQLPKNQPIINLSAVEYTKAVFPHLAASGQPEGVQVISPKFLTVSPKTGEPAFVTVHAKIARGAYAGWLIKNHIKTAEDLKKFAELGYQYDAELSTVDQPVFVAQAFKGLGLSVRIPKST